MESFVSIVNGFYSLTVVAKFYIIDVRSDPGTYMMLILIIYVKKC